MPQAERRKTLKPYTVYNHAIIHQEFLNWCVSRNLLATSPLAKVKLTKPPQTDSLAATLQQIDLLLQWAPADLAAQLATLAFTGIRAGELQNLRPTDIDLQSRWIHVRNREVWRTKTGASRKIPIHPRLYAYLAQLPRKKPYLFSAAPSKRYPNGDHHINTKHLNDRFQCLAKRLGMPTGRKQQGLVIHSLRHFFETFTVNADIPQRVVDIWMGHTGRRSMGAIYYHLTDEQSQAFMAKVPFGSALALTPSNPGAA